MCFGNITLNGAPPTPFLHSQYNTVVGEQPYKSRDMVGSDSGLGHLLVSVKKTEQVKSRATSNLFWKFLKICEALNIGLIWDLNSNLWPWGPVHQPSTIKYVNSAEPVFDLLFVLQILLAFWRRYLKNYLTQINLRLQY